MSGNSKPRGEGFFIMRVVSENIHDACGKPTSVQAVPVRRHRPVHGIRWQCGNDRATHVCAGEKRSRSLKDARNSIRPNAGKLPGHILVQPFRGGGALKTNTAKEPTADFLRNGFFGRRETGFRLSFNGIL